MRVGTYDPNILCLDCEALFSKIDDYAATALLDHDKITPVYFDDELTGYSLPKGNPALLQQFALSVLWRAHVSQRGEYLNSHLGAFEARIKELLKRPEPDWTDDFPLAIKREREDELRFIMVSPQTVALDDVHFSYFIIGGYGFLVKLDNKPIPPSFNSQTLGYLGDDFIGVWDARSTQIYAGLAQLAEAAALKDGHPFEKETKFVKCRIAPRCRWVCNNERQVCTFLRNLRTRK